MKEFNRLAPIEAPPRHPILKPRKIVRSDRCINCGQCIDACIYGCHDRLADDPRKMDDPQINCCRNCFACVFKCPRGALSMHDNEEFLATGNETYPAAVISSIQEQATSGKIPVSGAGYDGPFDGKGFDNIWTDMSEIVRPTRDGIHGREHISTTIHLGRMVDNLCGMCFDEDGNLESLIPPNREIPLPMLFGPLPFPVSKSIKLSMARAASRLNTYVTIDRSENPKDYAEFVNHLLVRLDPQDVLDGADALQWATIVEITESGDQEAAFTKARETNPHLLTVLAVQARKGVADTVLRLARHGGETIHLYCDETGTGADDVKLLDILAETHERLVEEGLRDRITLLASGGVARAEHVPKTILTGADGVFVDLPLLIALGCTICDECLGMERCPRDLGGVTDAWGATRIVNLMLCWRDQLLEVLGAMGIRDVRRLRGEKGRAVFADKAREDFLRRLDAGKLGVVPDPTPISIEATKALLERSANVVKDRFPTSLGNWRVEIDRARCTDCGICVESCQVDVLRRTEGKTALEEPIHARCLGPTCEEENEWCCVKACPWKAISIHQSSVGNVLGDKRWTARLIAETWRQARTGDIASDRRECQTGASGGGFDLLELAKTSQDGKRWEGDVDLSIPLNRREEGRAIRIPLPIYGGGMSYGSISLQVMRGRAMAATEIGTFTSTGEGGYPPELFDYADHVITQVATGLFGVREETLQCGRMMEFKYAQGAKPGLGGHLLGEKNTPEVAAMREAVPGTSLFSPFPFHSVYSVEDHKKHLDWIRTINPDIIISVKVSTPGDVDMVAVGSYYAGANVVHLDGAYGGTGAAPDIAKKNIAQPIEYGVSQAHDFLSKEGIRDRVVLIASGGVRTPEDVLKAIALGADGVVIGTAELIAINCVRCKNCERDRGCPIGIATTDHELAPQLESEWVRDRIVNMYQSWAKYMEKRLRALNLPSVAHLRGRRDLLRSVD